MKKIFQTGLAFGYENGACEVCNLDFSWLYNTPSNLLWIDKVVVTKPVWNIINGYEEPKNDPIKKSQRTIQLSAVKLIYQILDSVGLVEIVDSNEISEKDSQTIYNQIEKDLELLEHSGDLTTDGHIYSLGENDYCIPSLWTLYASLLYSYRNNCNFSLDNGELVFLRKILSYKCNKDISVSRKASAINEVIEMTLPMVRIWPEYFFEDKKKCNLCANLHSCSDNYLPYIEKKLLELLEQREYEEVKDFCKILDTICDKKFNDASEIDAKDLIRELNIEKVKVQRKLNKVYKNIKDWSKIIATVSAALSLGVLFDHPVLTTVGGVGVFASETTDKLADLFHRKHKWVNFVNKLR